MKELESLLLKLWEDFARLNPQAVKIHQLLESRSEKIVNDHIAFRTFGVSQVGITAFEKIFVDLGYQSKGEYQFKQKKLFAKHYEHQERGQPKIFISELLVDQLSEKTQTIIRRLVSEIPPGLTETKDFCVSGRPWKVKYSEYQELMKESEYAAWMSAFGFRVNHFTVNVNALESFSSLEGLNQFLKDQGFSLNSSGGEIKGGESDYLEQSSTNAARIELEFEEGRFEIPSCYYEFAKRYPMPDGKLYQGFVEKSADKIFESTHWGGGS
ncbi:MAG: DUF1338 domain-containing protein [Bradymonadales bacterium]|nr:MAG: DUF1338 domain-containing protein [Bradymonadales bacterium]